MRRNLFFVLTVLFVAAAIIARVHNHSTALSRANAIVAADQAGTPVTAAITALQHYTNTHTEASVSFGLTGSYNRAVAAAAAATAPTSSGQVYAAAQAACAGHADSITQANCVQAYLASHATAQPNPTPASSPQASAYSYHFIAPIITFDLSSVLLVLGLVCFVLAFTVSRRAV